MTLIRKPTIQEEKLLELLIMKSNSLVSENWQENLLVCTMNDGGMGSLYLYPTEEILQNRKMGKRISEFQFTDLDGVEVVVSLNVDSDGNLFELDIWKTDFGKLISLPV